MPEEETPESENQMLNVPVSVQDRTETHGQKPSNQICGSLCGVPISTLNLALAAAKLTSLAMDTLMQ